MKTVFISGASGGIGLSIVEKLLKEGYFVVAQANSNSQKVIELAKQLNLQDYVCVVNADFSSEEKTISMLQDVKNSFKHFDAIVTAHGIDLYSLLTDTTIADYDKIFDVNVKSTFLTLKELVPLMIERKSGKIVTVSSIWGTQGACMESVYSATKSAIIGLTKSLAKELAPSGINVNCVSPGVIDTAMNNRFDQDEKQDLIDRTPLSRLGNPIEIAELVYFLCSDKSNFITGQNITIDGGFTL